MVTDPDPYNKKTDMVQLSATEYHSLRPSYPYSLMIYSPGLDGIELGTLFNMNFFINLKNNGIPHLVAEHEVETSGDSTWAFVTQKHLFRSKVLIFSFKEQWQKDLIQLTEDIDSPLKDNRTLDKDALYISNMRPMIVSFRE